MSDRDNVLCRCECVAVASVDEAIAEGNLTINDVKRRTRAGMGICQGIYCLSAIAEQLIAAGVQPELIEPMTARPPTRLVPVGLAAALKELEPR
jgi:NAD(P)H-nitrite reductase large subunit